ncbi:jg11888 [Pararge aegeria aegeria]|uniref:Jg11888 protein n=1 Tax=Pararge aegeria aegeria TaxID=348720 RepID=A0A8S4SFH0_9NEOP|nr:jg11888 [Pararge aegeria aegeria]
MLRRITSSDENGLGAVRHPNPLVVEASTYTPAPGVKLRRRRSKHVLYDPDDRITSGNVCQQHTNTQLTQRLRRRRRGPRFLTSSGRGPLPRSRGRPD